MSITDDLLNLYRVDKQVRGLRSRLESAQRYLRSQDRLLEELDQQKAELETRQRQLQATIGNLEGEAEALDERLEKLRTELNNASTNKQYNAVLGELNLLKTQRSEIETRTLGHMETTDEIGGQLERVAAQRAEREKVRDVAKRELDQRHEDVGDRLAELDAERREAAASIPAKTLSVFNEMADAYDGDAMAVVEEIDRRRREYACGECNMHLPFEAIAALLGTDEAINRCHACGRILYMEEKTRGALAKK